MRRAVSYVIVFVLGSLAAQAVLDPIKPGDPIWGRDRQQQGCEP